jgi:hypothetical protein
VETRARPEQRLRSRKNRLAQMHAGRLAPAAYATQPERVTPRTAPDLAHWNFLTSRYRSLPLLMRSCAPIAYPRALPAQSESIRVHPGSGQADASPLDELGVTTAFIISDDGEGAITPFWRASMPFVLLGSKPPGSLGSFSCNPPAKSRSRERHRNALRRSARHPFRFRSACSKRHSRGRFFWPKPVVKSRRTRVFRETVR